MFLLFWFKKGHHKIGQDFYSKICSHQKEPTKHTSARVIDVSSVVDVAMSRGFIRDGSNQSCTRHSNPLTHLLLLGENVGYR